jgi:hypothetical protein
MHRKLKFLDYDQKLCIGEFIPFVVQSHKKRSAPNLIHYNGEFVVPACKLTKSDLIALLEEGDSPHEDVEAVFAEYFVAICMVSGQALWLLLRRTLLSL